MLRASPDDDTLLIYADALISEGDPRGELIALDLRVPERRPLLLRWLASHLSTVPGGDHLNVCDESWIPFLRSPIGAYCRGAAAFGRMEDAQRLVAAIIEQPRPFMTRFKMMAGFDGPLVMDMRHVEAMPNLVELDLDGDFDLRAFRHPNVKRLYRRSWSCNGLRSWTWPVDLPACEQLVVDAKPWSTTVSPARVTFAGLPNLRTLDVSDCEPQFLPARQKDKLNLDVFRWLAGLALVRQLRTLRVPSVRSSNDAKVLARLLDTAPRLEIEVARTYARSSATVASDRIRFAPPWPWLPGNEEHGRWQYTVTAPGGIVLHMLSGAICNGLERTFDGADEPYREDWRTIWKALDASHAAPQRLPFGLLLRAFTGFVTEDIGSATSLRNEIVGLAARIRADDLVTLTPKT